MLPCILPGETSGFVISSLWIDLRVGEVGEGGGPVASGEGRGGVEGGGRSLVSVAAFISEQLGRSLGDAINDASTAQ